MKILIFGASGMVGQGVLRECLEAPDVEQVVAVGRSPIGLRHVKLREAVVPDLSDLREIEPELQGTTACFFCLGVSSAGMDETEYSRITYDLTLAVARLLARIQPPMVFVYVSGTGTDSTEKGRSMWARVKGRTENALRRLPFKSVYLFRPGIIQPLHGIRSKTRWTRMMYAISRPLMPLLRALFPRQVLTTASIGQAMLNAVRHGAPRDVLESKDLYELANRTRE